MLQTSADKMKALRPTSFLALCCLSSVFLIGCNSLFYYPDDLMRLNPKKINLEYEAFAFKTKDKKKLHAWHIKAKGPAKGIIAHFHGNAENMSTHFLYVEWLAEYGYHVMTFDYRGYGKSTGNPTRKGLVLDGKAFLGAIAERAGLEKMDLFVLGQSLGGAVAVPTIAEFKPKNLRALILESTFSSYRKMAQEKLAGFWLTWPFQWPFSFLVTDDWSPIDYITQIKLPLLIIHGDRDPIVPFSEGKKLFNAAQHETKLFWTIPNGKHTPSFGKKESPYRLKLLKFLCQNSKQKSICRR